MLDSASTVFATNDDHRNLLPKTMKTDKIAIDTGNGEMVVQEWGATYAQLFSTNIVLGENLIAESLFSGTKVASLNSPVWIVPG